MRITDRMISGFSRSALSRFAGRAPWDLTANSHAVVSELLRTLSDDFVLDAEVAVHEGAVVEPGAVIKGPAIVGPLCFIAAGAYIRGGCWLHGRCVVGPGSELKSSFLFEGTKLAHFNFVGDSILGRDVNLEAGAIIANFRNELPDMAISLSHNGHRIDTGVMKFGSLIGDNTCIGANAVIAPGAILAPGSIVARLALIDQSLPEAP